MNERFRQEVVAVKELADQIGYGHMMEILSALWAIEFEDARIPISGAAVPTLLPYICDEEMRDAAIDQRNLYIDMIRGCDVL